MDAQVANNLSTTTTTTSHNINTTTTGTVAAAAVAPTTESTNTATATTSSSSSSSNVENDDWVCFDNSMDDATTLKVTNLKGKDDENNININNKNNINNNNTNINVATATGTVAANNGDGSVAASITDPVNATIGAGCSSSTAYSFTGSALYNDKNVCSNINLKPTTTTESNSATNNNNNNSSSSNKTTTSNNNNDDDNNKSDDSLYECNICLDTAKDAVVSLCGHLFCWPCLHQWLETRPNRKLCPVCKAAVDKDKVIPLYGRNSQRQEDPRNKVPPRPAGQRTEPEPPGFAGFGFGDSFHMSFGIGAFPFGYFTSSLNFGEPRPAAANRGTTQYEDEQTLSKLFLYLAFMCIAWLLFA